MEFKRILFATDYTVVTSLWENTSECLLFRWMFNVFVAIFFWGIASCLAVTENKDQIASCRNEGKSRSSRHCEKTCVNVYCLDGCSMFSWQSFFGGLLSCLAMTENKDQIASCRNEGKSRSLRHCEKTWVNVYCLDECSMFSAIFFWGDCFVPRNDGNKNEIASCLAMTINHRFKIEHQLYQNRTLLIKSNK